MGVVETSNSQHDDVSQFDIRTSRHKLRQCLDGKLLALGLHVVSDFKLPKYVRKTSVEPTNMADLNDKLTELEKRTKSLEIVYDTLLDRATELEKKALKNEVDFQHEKTTFDVVEILMRKDGRSKAMFDHVSLFFYVLLTKLHRKGIHINSTTELWARLNEDVVKAAYQNTVTNLGFTSQEVQALNVILDVLHEKDLTVYVNQNKVDTHNLTAKLKDLDEEFLVANPGSDEEKEGGDSVDNKSHDKKGIESSDGACAPVVNNAECEEGSDSVKNETDDKKGIESSDCACAPVVHSTECDDGCQPMNQPLVEDIEAAGGDTYTVDSLLLYLQIQNELNPLVTSALRRAVAVAHCSMTKSPLKHSNVSVREHGADIEQLNDELTLSCPSRTEVSDREKEDGLAVSAINNITTPLLEVTQDIQDKIPEGCGVPFFFDAVTSTPNTQITPQALTSTPNPQTISQKPTELNTSNNAIVVEELSLLEMAELCELAQSQGLEVEVEDDFIRQISLNRTCATPSRKGTKQTVSVDFDIANGEVDLTLFKTNDHKCFLARLDTVVTSQACHSTPQNGQNAKKLRTFYKQRVRQKTEEIVQKERASMKQFKSFKNKQFINREPCFETPTKTACEIYEIDEFDNLDDLSDSELTFLNTSSFYCHSNEPDVDQNSISLHEELSGFGFFALDSTRDSKYNYAGNDDSNHVTKSRALPSESVSESSTVAQEHVNFFASPTYVNPYGYDFEAEYYMLVPGQDLEMEMKDLSCDMLLDDVDQSEGDNSSDLEKSGQSLTDSETGHMNSFNEHKSNLGPWLLG